MRKPKNELERTARKKWMWGEPVQAMQALRAAGYDQAAREDFLLKVVGVTESGLSTCELHRDVHLDWLDEQ